MGLKQIKNPPAFNRSAAHGTVYGSGEESTVGRASYCQGGHYYTGDGRYVGSDADAKSVAAQPDVAAASDPGVRFVNEAEIDELLQHARAPDLLNLPLPTLAAMVKRAGGPAFSGDNAPKQYVAWLLKFTSD